MMQNDPMTPSLVATDAELVASALAGERAAFGEIVQRYQRLLCSIAYSATGQLSHSEDLAQEAFIEAWRRLPTLREPEKLRPWLCGILRFKVSRLRRDESRRPLGRADALDAAAEVATADAPIGDEAARKEEQAILWSALERVPETYREPLILFYREHRSIEHVADALDLSEDAVKQRLARGRKILQEEVLTFVEGALERSTPGRVFTAGVLAALPEIVTTTKVAGLGAVATKGGAIAKSTLVTAFAGSLSGVVGAVMTLRANLDQSRTPRERRFVVKVTVAAFCLAFAWIGLLWLTREAAIRSWVAPKVGAVAAQVFVAGGIIGWVALLRRVIQQGRKLRVTERRANPGAFSDGYRKASEFRTRWTLLGVPVFAARFSTAELAAPPVFAWFAAGDYAVGLIAAWGGVAVAPLSIGSVSIGILSIGSLAVGGFAIGQAGLGYIATGVGAIGVHTFAWLSALGWFSAQSGGFAVGGDVALGWFAWAKHANDAAATAVLANPEEGRAWLVIMSVIAIAAIIPAALYAREVRRRFGLRSK
jgi:RNA polymerase sigma factor (sigma-70 family)